MSFSQRLVHAGPRSSLTRRRTTLLACLAALFSLAAGVPYGIAEASAAPAPNVQKYLGYWNYDQPNLTTLNNVAVLACLGGGGQCDPQLPLPLKIPQVGWVRSQPARTAPSTGTPTSPVRVRLQPPAALAYPGSAHDQRAGLADTHVAAGRPAQ